MGITEDGASSGGVADDAAGAADDVAGNSAKGTSKTVVKSVDDVLDGATAGRVTKGKTTQSVKSGDFSRASNEFDSLNPSNVKNINTSYGQGKTGTLPDERTVTVRPGSTDGRPTLEISACADGFFPAIADR